MNRQLKQKNKGYDIEHEMLLNNDRMIMPRCDSN